MDKEKEANLEGEAFVVDREGIDRALAALSDYDQLSTAERDRATNTLQQTLESLAAALERCGLQLNKVCSDVEAERERTQQRLRHYAERLEILREIDQAILTARSMEELTQEVVRRISLLVPTVYASIALFHPERNAFHVLTAHIQDHIVDGVGLEVALPPQWNAYRSHLSQGKRLRLADVRELYPGDTDTTALQLPPSTSVECLPMLVRSHLYGCLNIGFKPPEHLTEDHIAIAEELADLLAIALRQIELDAQVRRHAEVLEQQIQQRTAALRDSQARFEAMFAEAAIGVALAGQDGQVVTSNPALQQMLGYSPVELNGLSLADLTQPDIVSNEITFYREMMEGHRTDFRTESCFRRKDSQLIYVNLTVSLVQRYGTPSRYAIVMVEDVTEQREAQSALIQAEKLSLTGKMTAALAHEINNPLQSVIGFMSLARELLDEGTDPHEACEYIQIAMEEVKRAADIVTRMRDFNRKSSPSERQPAAINPLIDRVITLTEKRFRDQKVELHWSPGVELPQVSMLPDRIQQVFLNLVLNALDAMPEGGHLDISTRRTLTPTGVQIRFSDSGPGIAEDELEHLFEPFYSTKATGMGLGLYVSQSIVEELDGRITVQNMENEGATFTVWLPAQ